MSLFKRPHLIHFGWWEIVIRGNVASTSAWLGKGGLVPFFYGITFGRVGVGVTLVERVATEAQGDGR